MKVTFTCMPARWLLFATLAACTTAEQPSVQRPTPAGGSTTIDDGTPSAFGFPAPNLDEAELARHVEGDVAFESRFVAPPAPVQGGLGPQYNHVGCSRCHVGDGRGLPRFDGAGSSMVVKLSAAAGAPTVPGGPPPVEDVGLQLHDHAVPPKLPDGSVSLGWIAQAGTYGDGEPFELRRPVLDVSIRGAKATAAILISARIPTPVFGLGLLEAVDSAVLEGLADPDDLDGDGISGRPNRVWDVVAKKTVLGRFGWKASSPNLLQQAAAAYAADMGIGTWLFPDEGGAIEIDDNTVRAVAFYTQTLAVPARRNVADPVVLRGEQAFRAARCHACHVEQLTTGDHPVVALRRQIIHPYTDLLLHNMGFDLSDGRPEFSAAPAEWRTAPLWGLGLAPVVLGGATYLHDGRARTLAEAILWHGGEAASSREHFRQASAEDRAALLAFLRSL